MANADLLSVENLSLRGKLGQSRLDPVSFSLAEGDRLGIIGPSGAGKTTLLRLLVRLQDPSSGQVRFRGQSLQSLSPLALRRQIVLVPQEPKLLGQAVRDALIYPLQLQQLAQSAIAERLEYWRSQMPFPDEWLDRGELQLSLGQRQWIGILRGLMMEPQILLLDEPTSALDPDRARQLLAILTHWTSCHPVAAVMVNHQREWVEGFAHRLLKLERGEGESRETAEPDGWDEAGDF
jgi:D-methionine transport system ATP-binding protein